MSAYERSGDQVNCYPQRGRIHAKNFTCSNRAGAGSRPGPYFTRCCCCSCGPFQGGLLYSFPTKAKLLEAMVEKYMQEHEQAMAVQETLQSGERKPGSPRFLDVYQFKPTRSLLLAVCLPLAENPDFMVPVRHYRGALLDRMVSDAVDPTLPHSSPIWQLPECKEASFSIAISSPMPSNIPCSAAWKPC